jgi:hypothetical protein
MTDPNSQNSYLKKVFILTHEPETAERLAKHLHFCHTSIFSDESRMWKNLAEQKVHLLILTYNDNANKCKSLLEELKKRHPQTQRMLWANFDHLPQIISSGSGRLVERILPSPVKPQTAQRVIAQNIGFKLEDDPTVLHYSASFVRMVEKSTELLKWTAEQLTLTHGSVLRPPPTDAQILHLQFVMPKDDRITKIREQLPARWAWPKKAYGQKMDRQLKKHPVLQALGKLEKNQEIYIQQVSDDTYLYLVLLPWKKEAKCTVVLGVHHETEQSDPFKEALDVIYVDCLSAVSQFHYSLSESTEQTKTNKKSPDYISEYDWVAAQNYVGPDRRNEPTPFMNAYAVRGRRKSVPKKLTQLGGQFVDQMTPWMRIFFWLYVVLSAIDTVLTYIYVGGGHFNELNPFLRPLIPDHMWLFVILKNSVSLSTFFVVTRFQLFRIGQFFATINVAGYAGLDIYWALLLLS